MADKTEQDYKTEMLTCPPRILPSDGKAALSLIHPDILAKNYCCGLRFPDLLDGLHVLSLGCGFVRDCFLLSKLVGEEGAVVGADPSDQVISFAEDFLDYHRQACGHSKSNVRMVKCQPEGLLDTGIQENYFDLVCFNTVLGLTPKKREIMDQLHRALKTGGEMFFTEMVASSRVREEVKKDQSLWGEGLAGAFYFEDLVSMAREFGFSTPRLVQGTDMRIKEPDLEEFIGGVKYSMATYRMFKLPSDPPQQQAVLEYQNPEPNTLSMSVINFDSCNQFKSGEAVRVDPEIAAIIRSSRYSNVFKTTESIKEVSVLKTCPVNPFETEKM